MAEIIKTVNGDLVTTIGSTGIQIFNGEILNILDIKAVKAGTVAPPAAEGYEHTVMGVAAGSISAVMGVATANVSKVNGV